MSEHPTEDADRTDGTARTPNDGLDLSRRTYCKSLAAAAVGTAAIGSSAAAPPGGDHDAVMNLVPTSEATHTATSSGSWSDGAVWAGGSPPGDGAQVHVESGVTVTLDHEDAARLAWIRVDGTLAFDPSADTRLRVDTIVTTEGSSLEIGTQATPIQSGVTAEIEFIDRGSIDESWDPTRVSRGLLPMGDVEIVGAEKTGHTTLATPPTPGDGSLELDSTPTNWSAGDTLVVPGVSPAENQDEEVTIASVNGTTVSLSETIQYDHSPPASDLDSYVCNLDRNVRLRSESTDVGRRGHVMLMSRGTTIEYAGLYELGRTDKSSPFSDPLYKESEIRNDGVFDLETNDNRKARYPLHFHKTGAYRDVEPHEVTGCVVAPHTDGQGWKGSPGWGFTNHQSYAHVQKCVSYRVFGTHFMTETGNEIGTFHDNFALRSEGTGDDPDWREVVAWADHANRPLIDDYGHGGHGFWLHGPLVSVENNVAAGHRNFAYAYWTRALGDFVPEDVDDPAVPPSELDREIVEADIGRHRGTIPNVPADYADDKPSVEHNVGPDSDGPNVADFAHARYEADDGTVYVDEGAIPIRNVDNVAFASGSGIDVMNHMQGVEGERDTVSGNDEYYGLIKDFTAYNIGARDGEDDLPSFSMRQGGEVNFEFPRGVDIGISMRYSKHLKIEGARLIGVGDGAAITHNMRATNMHVEDVTIENWDDGVGALTKGITTIRNPSFSDIANSEINVRGEQILSGEPTTHLEGVDESDEIYLDATADVESDWEWSITLDGGDVYYDEVAPAEAEDDPRLTGGQIVGGSGGGGGSQEPAAPTNLSSPAQTESSIDVSWDHDGENTAYYNVFVDGTVEATPSGTSATISDLEADTTYDVHVTADTGDGTQSPDSNAISVTTGSGSANGVAAAIDVGGDGLTAADGTTYAADTDFSGGNTASVGDAIAGTDDDALYQSERWGDFTYDVPVEDGTYTVELHFAENFFEADGSRVFSVSLEGTEVLSDLDIHAEAGHDAALVETISGVDVSGGSLTLSATASVDNPKLSAIRILEDGSDGGSGGGGTDPGLPTTLDSVDYDDSTGDFQTEGNGDGGESIGWISDGDWWAFDGVLDGSATVDVSVRVASNVDTGALSIEVDGESVSDPVDVSSTGGWYEWEDVTVATGVSVAADSEVRVVSEGPDWNFDEVRLE